jgi:hypothetical protein
MVSQLLFCFINISTKVECIIRGTPVIVNKIGGVSEYLGDNYPLYFNSLDEVPRKNKRGPGNVLEMRVFSKKSIISFLEKSGFIDIIFYDITEDMNKYGIFWSKYGVNDCSLIISAKKPAFYTFSHLKCPFYKFG